LVNSELSMVNFTISLLLTIDLRSKIDFSHWVCMVNGEWLIVNFITSSLFTFHLRSKIDLSH